MTTITAEQALKSKQNFTEYLADNTPALVTSTIANYQSKSGKVVVTIAELTQNFETFVNAVNEPTVLELPQKPYFAWIVTSPKDRIMNVLKVVNESSTGDLGIFVFKAFLNGDKMDFECLLKPELKEKQKREKTITKTGGIQYDYWKVYSEVCDEMGEGDYQIKPASQHYQNIPIGLKGAYIKQTISVKDNYVASELFIGDNKQLFADLKEHEKEIEKELGTLTWDCKDSNKSCFIRRTIFVDFTNPERYQEYAKQQIELAIKVRETFFKYI